MKSQERRPKIFFADQFSGLGGGQRYFFDIVMRAKHMGFPIGAGLPLQGPLVEKLRSAGVEIIPLQVPEMSIGKKGLADVLGMLVLCLRVFWGLRNFKSYDVFYVNGPRLFIPFWLLAISFLKHKAFIYHLHLDHSPLEKRIISFLAKASSTAFILCNSSFTKESLLKERPELLGNPRIEVLPLGLREGQAGAFDNRFNESLSQFRFVCIGRVSQEKGQDIFARLAEVYPQHEFHIVGNTDFSDKDFYQDLRIKKLDNLFFTESVNSVSDWIASVRPHFSIIPSRATESFGLVAIESMANSCLTLGRLRGGLKEIASKTGLLGFDLDSDLDVLVRHLISSTPEALKSLTKSQYDKTCEAFSASKYQEALEGFLTRIA